MISHEEEVRRALAHKGQTPLEIQVDGLTRELIDLNERHIVEMSSVCDWIKKLEDRITSLEGVLKHG